MAKIAIGDDWHLRTGVAILRALEVLTAPILRTLAACGHSRPRASAVSHSLFCGGHVGGGRCVCGVRGVRGRGVGGRGSRVWLSRLLLLFSVQVDLDGDHGAGGESERTECALEALCAGELEGRDELAPDGSSASMSLTALACAQRQYRFVFHY